MQIEENEKSCFFPGNVGKNISGNIFDMILNICVALNSINKSVKS